jgi:hypothetical protein
VSLAYTVDVLNRIIAIDGSWDDFASANGAPELTRDSVLGRSLLDYIDGAETAELVALLFERARRTPVSSIPFRCDSPTRRRFLRLALRADKKGQVRCESTLEREEERAFQPLLDAGVAREGGLVVMCSWCRKVRLPDGRWVEVEEAAAPLRLFGSSPQISHGVCEPCAEMVRASRRRPDGDS